MSSNLDPSTLAEFLSAVYTHELNRHMQELEYHLRHIKDALSSDEWPSVIAGREVARLAGLVYADILAPGIVMRRWQAEQEVGHTTV